MIVFDYIVIGSIVCYVIWIPIEWYMVNKHEKNGESLVYDDETKKYKWVK